MKLLRRLALRLIGLFPSKNREADLSAELEAHLSLATDANLRAGMSPIEARRRALHDLGGLEHTRQAYRESAALPLLEDLLHDLSFALRQLRKNLGFTLTAILMLALGTCAAVSIFAFVDAALLKPLPYKDPASLVGVFERVPLFEHSSIACINVASLLLVRSESRRREISIRGALGASPARITRQFITESLLLVLTGTAIGLAFATAAMQLLLKLIPRNMMSRMPFLLGLGLNPRVLAFTALIALGAAIGFSLTPTLRLLLKHIGRGLADGTRNVSGLTWRRFGSNLVILELATAMVLLVGAGLLGKSLYLLLRVLSSPSSLFSAFSPPSFPSS